MSNNLMKVRCNEMDRRTLLIFKQGVIDPSNKFDTWFSEKDCCAWKGVECDNTTSRVTKLDLAEQSLKGAMNLSLLELEFLNHLDLSRNDFSFIISIPPIHNISYSNLVTLDLSYNNFNSKLPHWLFNISNDISHLDLSYNSFYGEIPSSLFNQQNLKYLDLSYNAFSGSIPSALGNLTSLVSLNMGSNSFSGAVSETHFSRLSKLETLVLTNSSLAFHFNPEWKPVFQLKSLDLENTHLGPELPPWIYTQKQLEYLSIASSGISFVDKDRFMSLLVGISFMLDMSRNSISEDISNVMLNSTFIMLRYNNFQGRLPQLSSNAYYLDLSHNSFTGFIPSGWEKLKSLEYINLWNNKLFGEVLVKLSNSKRLEVMNLGKNEFSGTIPINMSHKLQVVILRYNQFEGSIQPQLFNLSDLIHLDLAHNKLSGSLPVVYSTTKMVNNNISFPYFDDDIINLFTKGQDYIYEVNPERRTVDLSANNLIGEIPSKLFGLIEVQTLNISYNHFTGTIPKTIGDMKNLESLDLSNNKLSGEIPQNMAALSFLGFLNLSCNNFTGQIPIGTQLQSFDASSYIGNLELCGAPLKKCSTEEKDPGNAKEQVGNEDGDSEKESMYLGMGVGFAVGFWGICGSLIVLREWRLKYYHFLNRVFDQLYVAYMVKYNNFLNRGVPAS